MNLNGKWKLPVGVLTISSAFFAGLIKYEGYSKEPYRDAVGVPTIGIGSTKYPDGSRVSMTDKPVSKSEAISIVKSHVSKDEKAFKASVAGVYLHQDEYDVYMDFVYNFGLGNWDKSRMRRELLAGNHVGACKALLRYKYAGGRDCSIRANHCIGVWRRQLERYNKCMSVN